MKIEREYRYVGFDLEAMIAAAKQFAVPQTLKFKRAVFDIPGKEGWLRLRTDGKTTTLTVKVASKERPSESLESELLVSDFGNALAVLNILGFVPRSIQTNYRILFRIRDCDVTVDLWPKIPPLVEIEGEKVEIIEEAEKLFKCLTGFRTSKTVSELYSDVGIDVKYAKDLDFEIVPPIVLNIEKE